MRTIRMKIVMCSLALAVLMLASLALSNSAVPTPALSAVDDFTVAVKAPSRDLDNATKSNPHSGCASCQGASQEANQEGTAGACCQGACCQAKRQSAASAGGCCSQVVPQQAAQRSPTDDRLFVNAENEQAAAAAQEQGAAKSASQQALAKGVTAREAVTAFAQALAGEGAADCCIGPSCELCPLAVNACGCAASVRKGGPVCPECWGGWQAGHGRIAGVQPDSVKVVPRETMKMIYDMRAKMYEKAGQR